MCACNEYSKKLWELKQNQSKQKNTCVRTHFQWCIVSTCECMRWTHYVRDEYFFLRTKKKFQEYSIRMNSNENGFKMNFFFIENFQIYCIPFFEREKWFLFSFNNIVISSRVFEHLCACVCVGFAMQSSYDGWWSSA